MDENLNQNIFANERFFFTLPVTRVWANNGFNFSFPNAGWENLCFDIIIYPQFVKISLITWTVVDKIESELLKTAKCTISEIEVNKINENLNFGKESRFWGILSVHHLTETVVEMSAAINESRKDISRPIESGVTPHELLHWNEIFLTKLADWSSKTASTKQNWKRLEL